MPKTTPFAELAGVLRDAREALGLSQEEVADRIGVRGRTYQRWEAGENAPRGAGTANVERVLDLEHGTITRTLGQGSAPVSVMAADTAREVDELRARVAELEARAVADEDRLRATIDAIVAAKLAEAAAIEGSPSLPDEERRGGRGSAA